ncbi:MAG: hypothetical protein FJ352_00335 [Firmicutes bacterium]|nr:hypothetical protein [Bacillota bacterium]
MKTLKLIFQSIFSNEPIMQARSQPWYVAILLFVLSILLATYPTYTQVLNREGSTFLSGNTFSIENALLSFTEALDEEGVDLVVVSETIDGETKYYLDNQGVAWDDAFSQTLPSEEAYPYFDYSVNGSSRLRVFLQADDQSNEAVGEFASRLLALPTGDDQIGSFLLLTKSAVYMYVYNPAALAEGSVNGEGFATAFTGTYDEVPLGTNLANFAQVDQDGNVIDPTEVSEYVNLVFANWLNFFDQSFAYSKSVLLLAQTGLTLVVNAVMALMMSIVIFIMTRGKLNPNNHFKFGETMKMGAWSLFSPALLTIVAGALFPEFAGTAFVLFVGLRLMWLSSKYLRPVDANVVPNTTKK